MTSEIAPALLDLPDLAGRTVPDLLDRSRAFGADRPFLHDLGSGRTLTYGAFPEWVGPLAARLPPGSLLAVMLPNGLVYVVLRFALTCAGRVEVALNGAHRGPVLAGILETLNRSPSSSPSASGTTSRAAATRSTISR